MTYSLQNFKEVQISADINITGSSNVATMGDILIQDEAIPELIRALSHALQEEEVNYCVWKGAFSVEQLIKGEKDLDFLISHESQQIFTAILFRLGFKEAWLPVKKRMPGMVDFYGYDEQTSKTVHVHAHYQLIVGHKTTKNYRLHIEKPFLASATQHGVFKFSSPEFELILFVIRMMLRHATWDTVLSFRNKFSDSEQAEFSFLAKRADLNQVRKILARYLPALDFPLFERCLRALASESTFIFRAKTGFQLQSQLNGYARQPTIVKHWWRLYWGIRAKLFRLRPKKQMAKGGAIIALIGGDGSGKSTSVNEVYEWLSENFVTMKVHLGKPSMSFGTFFIKGFMKAGRISGIFPQRRVPVQFGENDQLPSYPGYAWLLWHVLTAWDRYRLYRRALRFATNGGLVICDRFPLAHIRSMDGVRTDWLLRSQEANRLIRYLVNQEIKFYERILPPDILIVMRVNPDIAVQRRMDEDIEAVRIRCKEIWDTDWTVIDAHVIDSSKPIPGMISEIKSLIWSVL